jgi:hypothetical protein
MKEKETNRRGGNKRGGEEAEFNRQKRDDNIWGSYEKEIKEPKQRGRK